MYNFTAGQTFNSSSPLTQSKNVSAADGVPNGATITSITSKHTVTTDYPNDINLVGTYPNNAQMFNHTYSG